MTSSEEDDRFYVVSRISGNNFDIVGIQERNGSTIYVRCKPGTLELSDYEDDQGSSPSRFDT